LSIEKIQNVFAVKSLGKIKKCSAVNSSKKLLNKSIFLKNNFKIFNGKFSEKR
jgi:hypothetical protein